MPGSLPWRRAPASLPLPHLAVCALVGGALAALLAGGLLSDPGSPAATRVARPTRRLTALGIIAFCALLAEGVVFDWSGVYLSKQAAAGAGLAPLGLAAFSVCMGLGRLIGDRAAARLGASAVVRAGAVIAPLGLSWALASARPIAAILGFAVMGLGLSAVFPLALRASGRQGQASALAAVSTVGYGGFLVGPPVIGLLAGASSLRTALIFVCGRCLVAAALGGQVGQDERDTEHAPTH